MKDIFTDLYKKVVGFFQATEEKEKENAKDVACNRLKFVLMQDRTNLNPFLLERLRGEMIDVLSKYVEMDKEALELSFEQEGEQMALMLSIPVIRAKEEEEIQALIAAEEEAKAAKAEAEEAAKQLSSSEAEQEETEEDAQGDATETVDAESENSENSEDAEDEEVCACGEDAEEECDSDEDAEEEEEEAPSSKKSKKNKK